MVAERVEHELGLFTGSRDGADVLPATVGDLLLVGADHVSRTESFDRLDRGPPDQPGSLFGDPPPVDVGIGLVVLRGQPGPAGQLRGGAEPGHVADPGYVALQQLPGVGPILAAVFRTEVGDVTRFGTAAQLACWAGLTPKHHESDTHVHRGRITKQGSRLVRWAAVESVKRLGPTHVVGAYKKQVADRRGKNIGTVAAARKQTEFVFYALRDHHVRALHPPRPPAGAAA